MHGEKTRKITTSSFMLFIYVILPSQTPKLRALFSVFICERVYFGLFPSLFRVLK